MPSLCLLELKENGVVLIMAEQQQDPGASAHAADTDDLAGSMNVAVVVQQLLAVVGQRVPVCVEHPPHGRLEVSLFCPR